MFLTVLVLKSVLFQGEKSFFLRPGERLESGIQNLFVLGDDEGLILRAHEEFVQDSKVCLSRNHTSFGCFPWKSYFIWVFLFRNHT